MAAKKGMNWGVLALVSGAALVMQLVGWSGETEAQPTAVQVLSGLGFVLGAIGLVGSLVMLAKGRAGQG